MGRPRKNKETSFTLPESDDSASTTTTTEETPTTTTATTTESTEQRSIVEREDATAPAKRISLKLNQDGTIDFGSMRDATAKQFKDAVKATSKTVDGVKGLGLAPTQTIESVPPELAAALYDLLSPVEVWIAKKKGIDEEIARTCFTYSEQEKAILAKPTAKVLSKYVPDAVGQYSDELTLIAALIKIHEIKLAACVHLTKQKEAEKSTTLENRTAQQVESAVAVATHSDVSSESDSFAATA